ncbi:hypothetical protein DSECCO2_315590 [anaerobic digester metagenome]
MIIRIMGDGQYTVNSSLFDALNAIDNEIVEIVQRGDDEQFKKRLSDLIGLIQKEGQRVSDLELVESDVIVPPADMILVEARDVFTGTGIFEG